MAGYTRQSSADIVATAIVRANPLNLEFDQVLAAFNASTGHKHDGTAAEGAYVPLIADSDALNKVVIDTSNNRVGVFVEVSAAAVEQVRFQDGLITPVTNNDIDLGTASLKFKNGYFAGNLTVDGNITLGGDITLGDADTDSITLGAEVASHVIPDVDNTYDLGSSTKEWRNLYIDGIANIDSLVADTADINGGTIDAATIGGTTAAAGTFTTLTATGTTTLNGSIDLDPAGSDKVTFKGNATRGSGQFVLNCEQNTHAITIKGPAHSAAANYTLTFPDNDGNDGDALKSDGSGNLSFGTPYQLMVENVGASPTLPVIGSTSSENSIALGHQANVGNNCGASIAIMGTIVKNGTTDNLASMSIGAVSEVPGGLLQTAVGPYAYAGGYGTQNTLALGGSRATGTYSTAVGNATSLTTYGATATKAISIGFQALASHDNSIAIGADSVSSANNRISLGSSSQTVEISAAYRLPSSDGTANQVLQTDGSGTLTFATVSGAGGLSNVVDDTTPQLGGNLDVNGNSIVSVSAGNIAITPDTTGSIVLDGLNWPQADGSANQVLYTNGSGQLAFKTVLSNLVEDTTPQLGGALDAQSNNITSLGTINTHTIPGGTGTFALTSDITFTEVSNDTTPQLGGNLDVNGNSIVSASAGNIAITPDTTGSIILDGQNWPQADGSANQFLKTNGSGQLSYATVTQATGNELENVVEDTTPQLGGNLDLNSNNITGTGDITITGDIKPTTYQETVGTESSGTLDLSTGNVFSHAPSANVTYVFSNPPSTGTAFGFTLKVTPSATITQTWPASVDWAGGTAPDATASGETDVFTFYTQDGGTTYYGFQAGNAMA